MRGPAGLLVWDKTEDPVVCDPMSFEICPPYGYPGLLGSQTSLRPLTPPLLFCIPASRASKLLSNHLSNHLHSLKASQPASQPTNQTDTRVPIPNSGEPGN